MKIQFLMKQIEILKKLIELMRRLLELKLKKKEIYYIVLHHTATARDYTSFEAINRGHKERWNYPSKLGLFCGYQYLITGEGKIHQARLDIEQGIHCKGHNDRTIAIALTGNFMKEKMSQAQIISLEKLLAEKLKQYNLDKSKIKLHKDFSNTNCPGSNFVDWISDYKNT